MKRKLFIIIFTACIAIVYSQQTDSLNTNNGLSLDEIVISANKVEENKKNVAQQVQVLNLKTIQNAQALTTAELISNAGIHVQKSQLGGGSPVLRGFEASRIGLVIDGVRLNNLIFRAGHLQDIIKTDVNIFDRVEILFGPSSTIYGSDALGGVIHMYTKKPQLSMNDEKLNINANVMSRYESVAEALTEHVNFNIGSTKFASLTSFTYNKYGDLQGGKNQNPFYNKSYGERKFYVKELGVINGAVKDSIIKNANPYLQVGSGYTQYDILQKFLFKQSEKISHGLNIQYSNTTDVPRYDRLTDPSGSTVLASAQWYYGPQKRMLVAYDLNLNNAEGFFQAIHFGVNYQDLQESRHNRNFGNRNITHRIEDVSVIGANFDLQRSTEKHNVRLGLDVQLNNLKSTAERRNIVVDTGSIGNWDSRYPDGKNKMNNFALYFSHTWKINDELVLTDGIRGGYSTLHSTIVNNKVMFDLPYNDIKQNTPVYSGSLGLVNTPTDDLKLSLLFSTGYRVPNIDDMVKIFGSAPGMVIVPNTELKAEKTLNYELGITRIYNNKTKWENTFYYTQFRDVAVVLPFTFNGKDSLEYDGVLSKVFANQNRDRAYIYGLSSNLFSQLDNHFSFGLGINYTYGRVQTDTTNSPLDHIPPFNARTSFQYKNGRFSSELNAIYNSWKRLENYGGGEDNIQYATPEGMPAWLTLNLRAAYKISKLFTVQGGIDNMFDTQYRTFASGINAPGRNFIIAVRGSF